MWIAIFIYNNNNKVEISPSFINIYFNLILNSNFKLTIKLNKLLK